MIYEAIIIGSGPAGLTAGIYLSRFKRNPLIIEGGEPGGQLMMTGAVENWPGNLSVDGPTLMKNIREHAEKSGATFLAQQVISVDFSKQPFSLTTKDKKVLQTRSLIVATGAHPRKLGVPGENEYWGKGVNVCATCDAPLYADKEVIVVGGGNSAIAEAYALGKYAKKVTIIHVLDELTATDPLKDEVLKNPKVFVICCEKVIKVNGDETGVTSVVLENQKTKITRDHSVSEFSTQGVFVAIGYVPNSKLFVGQVEIDERGYIVRTDGAQTSVPGVFAAGDVTDFKYRQAITASGQGCAAAIECEGFLKNPK
ncbi:thioredoxin-disulfide reductase [Candidatus Babeliales bacterium]|nr:thioredoxin-disulfide reductase [Candidatus Babeliales bacterium]